MAWNRCRTAPGAPDRAAVHYLRRSDWKWNPLRKARDWGMCTALPVFFNITTEKSCKASTLAKHAGINIEILRLYFYIEFTNYLVDL